MNRRQLSRLEARLSEHNAITPTPDELEGLSIQDKVTVVVDKIAKRAQRQADRLEAERLLASIRAGHYAPRDEDGEAYPVEAVIASIKRDFPLTDSHE